MLFYYLRIIQLQMWRIVLKSMAVYSNEKILVKYPRQMNFFFFWLFIYFFIKYAIWVSTDGRPWHSHSTPPPPVAYPKSPNFLYQKMFPFLFNQKILELSLVMLTFNWKNVIKGKKLFVLRQRTCVIILNHQNRF